MAGNLADIIMCAKFQGDILGVKILQGVKFPIFLLIFAWALQQCSATALPVISRTLRPKLGESFTNVIITFMTCLGTFLKILVERLLDQSTSHEHLFPMHN